MGDIDNKKNMCPMCGGRQKQGTTTFTVDLGFGVVVVRNVPALICEICGEEWLQDQIAEALEHIVDQARQRQRMVEIVQYDQETEYSLAS